LKVKILCPQKPIIVAAEKDTRYEDNKLNLR
jgi:hypothetical protein